ncbi:S8 family serine peptidase, partial [Roseomonas sp. PWR1]
GAGDGGAGAGGGGGGGGGGGAAGDGGGWAGGRGQPNLGPNPGRIPMPESWHRTLDRLFGATPGVSPPAPAAVAPAARPAAPQAELVAARVPESALPALRAQGFSVVATRPGLVRLRGPQGLTEAQALARLRSIAPGALADRNHRYRLAATPDAGAVPPSDAAAPAPAVATCPARPGLFAIIDTGVDARLPALAGVIERQETLRGPGRRPARTAHGTAVALRLAAHLPGVRIAVLDAFHLGQDGESSDAYDLASALARAASIGARIANVSVVGPQNAVVAEMGAQAAAQGVLFVAAAGNDGPRAAPLYPAAHPWAVAVSAVDERGRPWARSAAGPHIAFSAHGVEVTLGGGGAPARRWSGTSFAAPLVAAALAAIPEEGPARIERLAAAARDAGPPGRDPVYGWGVVDPRQCEDRPRAGDEPPPVSGSDRNADR